MGSLPVSSIVRIKNIYIPQRRGLRCLFIKGSMHINGIISSPNNWGLGHLEEYMPYLFKVQMPLIINLVIFLRDKNSSLD